MWLLIYLIYNNLLSLSQAWVATSKLSFALGWWPIPLSGLVLALLLFAYRQNQVAWRFNPLQWLRSKRQAA